MITGEMQYLYRKIRSSNNGVMGVSLIKMEEFFRLFHGTSSGRFLQMIERGRIEVSSKVPTLYRVDKLYSPRTYDLWSRAGGGVTLRLSIGQILNTQEKGGAKLSHPLSSYLSYVRTNIEAETQVRYPELKGRKLSKFIWQKYVNTELGVSLYEGNQSKDIVYLATEQKAANYATNFLIDSQGLEGASYLANTSNEVGVLLCVKVDQENLLPDMNDGVMYGITERLDWRRTLVSIGQCMHKGAIPTEAIEGVMFLQPRTNEKWQLPDLPYNRYLTYREAVSFMLYQK